MGVAYDWHGWVSDALLQLRVHTPGSAQLRDACSHTGSLLRCCCALVVLPHMHNQVVHWTIITEAMLVPHGCASYRMTRPAS